jgi:hypothetical protein
MLTLKNDLIYRKFKQAKRFIGKAYRATKLFMNPTKSIAKIISETVRDVGSQYPPQVRQILAKHGNHKITSIKLCKEVVSENTEFLLKALAGKNTWEEAKRKNGFDKFYHLFMIATMDDGSSLHIEKNEVIRISENPRACPDALEIGAPSQPTTINEMMERTKQRIGDSNFFTYDPFTNNCQMFITQLLRTLGLSNQTSNNFVYQDIQGLRESLPSYTKYLAKGLTNVGAFFNTAYQKTKDYIENGTEAEGLDNQTNAS